MAHFIGYVKGNRGEASRLGSKSSGMDATARGWNIGGSVWVGYDEERGEDFVDLQIDSGSNGSMGTVKRFKRVYASELKDLK